MKKYPLDKIEKDLDVLKILMQRASGLSPQEYQKRVKVENTIADIVYEYPTKDRNGFMHEEIDALLEKLKEIFPKNADKLNQENFCEKLGVCTQMLNENNESITYHCDVAKAIKQIVSNRKEYSWEWD